MKRLLFAFLFGGIFLALSLFCSILFFSKADFSEEQRVSDEFLFSRGEWESTLTQLPPSIRNRIYANEELFFSEMKEILAYDYQLFLHIDPHTPLSTEFYPPPHLVSLSNYPVKISKPMELQKSAADAFLVLSHSAKAHHIQLVAISAFRTFAYQENLYKRLKKETGRAGAPVSAAPGHSQHHLATAVDFNVLSQDFEATREGRWLLENAPRFGWSLSYPQGCEQITGYDYEPWHYRYITPAGCRLQKDFFDDIQFYLTQYLHNFYHFYKENEIHE